jgi:Amt family ammonium transporter
VAIGAVAGALVVFSIIGLDKVKIDDPVGAISVHGVCGFFGLMVVPLSNADATFSAQLLGAAVIFAWVFGASLVVWGILKATMGIRVSEEEEMEGMDMHDCGVGAYPEFVTVK